jgi:hypothetical protein
MFNSSSQIQLKHELWTISTQSMIQGGWKSQLGKALFMAQMKWYVPGHLTFNFTGAKTLMDHATWSKVLVSNRDYVDRTATFSFHWHTGPCKARIKSCQSEGCHPTDSDFLRTFTQVQMVEGIAHPCYPTQLATYITANTFGKICQKTCRCYEHVRFPSISGIHLQYCASFIIL